MGSKPLTTQIYIDKIKNIYGDTYDYSILCYINSHTKIKIICPIHGIFEKYPNDFLKAGCQKCSYKKMEITLEEFLIKAKTVHNDKYDYNLIKEINYKTKIPILCNKHGIFYQRYDQHLADRGCPKCAVGYSKSELQIEKWLISHNINYKTQYKFIDCKNVYKLPFDFYLPDYNICIEFDGLQHYEPTYGMKSFLRTNNNDDIKTKYCFDNNIKLIRIPYWKQYQVGEILTIMII
jgi:hypothetical protein